MSKRTFKVQTFEARWTYDTVADAAYIYLGAPIAKGGVKRTEICTNCNLDYDKSGRLLGIEILGRKWLPPALALTLDPPKKQKKNPRACKESSLVAWGAHLLAKKQKKASKK